MTSRMRRILDQQRRRSHSEFVFVREDGKTPLSESMLSKWMKKAVAEAKLDSALTFHSLRHSFGTRLGESRADAFTIMRIMGHSSVTVSQRYVHPTPQTMENAIIRMEEINRAYAAPKKPAKTKNKVEKGSHVFVHGRSRAKMDSAVSY